jgi:hypothetical protein
VQVIILPSAAAIGDYAADVILRAARLDGKSHVVEREPRSELLHEVTNFDHQTSLSSRNIASHYAGWCLIQAGR